MDATHFDAMTRALVAPRSRRRVLVAAVGAALGGLLGAAGLKEAAAACREVGEKCAADGDCCAGARCNGKGRCVCKAGRTNCDGRCRDLVTDEQNCGACGQTIPAGKICCFRRARDPETDPNNCGACGVSCPTLTSCCGGACVNLNLSPVHCGACNRQCAPGKSCCRGACVDYETSPVHCGGCDKACAAGKTCCKGHCVAACPPGSTRDPATCQCRCTATGQPPCNGVCCPSGWVCENATSCKVPLNGICFFNEQCLDGVCGGDGRCCQPSGAACSADAQCCSNHCNAAFFPGQPGSCS